MGTGLLLLLLLPLTPPGRCSYRAAGDDEGVTGIWNGGTRADMVEEVTLA